MVGNFTERTHNFSHVTGSIGFGSVTEGMKNCDTKKTFILLL